MRCRCHIRGHRLADASSVPEIFDWRGVESKERAMQAIKICSRAVFFSFSVHRQLIPVRVVGRGCFAFCCLGWFCVLGFAS